MKPIAFLSATLIAATLLSPVRSAPAQPNARRIEITARRFEFNPSEVTLKRGEPVVIVLKSLDTPHGIRFRELGIDTHANKGQSSELAFTPDKLGTFVGHCAIFCGAGHGRMTLTLHVVE